MSGSAELHARAKALFLAVRGAPAGERAALLASACAGDDELRREVESLLAHDLPDTILEAPAHGAVAVAAATPSAATGLSSSPGRLLWRQKRLLFTGLAVLALLLAVGLWTLDRVTASLHGVLEESLTTILDADVEALEQWVAREQAFARRWAEDAEVARLVAGLQAAAAGLDAPAAALIASPDLAALRRLLAPALAERGLFAYGASCRGWRPSGQGEPPARASWPRWCS